MFTLNFRSPGLMLAVVWLASSSSSGWGQSAQYIAATPQNQPQQGLLSLQSDHAQPTTAISEGAQTQPRAFAGSMSDKAHFAFADQPQTPSQLNRPSPSRVPVRGQPVGSSNSLEASVQASSLQPELSQIDESQRPLRFSVSTYTGKLAQAEQLFAASKVEPVFLTSAAVVQKTEREQIDQHDPTVTLPWEDRVYTWAAPQFYHKPLYFQQVNLERYGVGPCSLLQPAHSALHFYGSTILWPGEMLWNAPAKSIYSLGHQRPGIALIINAYRQSKLT